MNRMPGESVACLARLSTLLLLSVPMYLGIRKINCVLYYIQNCIMNM